MAEQRGQHLVPLRNPGILTKALLDSHLQTPWFRRLSPAKLKDLEFPKLSGRVFLLPRKSYNTNIWLDSTHTSLPLSKSWGKLETLQNAEEKGGELLFSAQSNCRSEDSVPQKVSSLVGEYWHLQSLPSHWGRTSQLLNPGLQRENDNTGAFQGPAYHDNGLRMREEGQEDSSIPLSTLLPETSQIIPHGLPPPLSSRRTVCAHHPPKSRTCPLLCETHFYPLGCSEFVPILLRLLLRSPWGSNITKYCLSNHLIAQCEEKLTSHVMEAQIHVFSGEVPNKTMSHWW